MKPEWKKYLHAGVTVFLLFLCIHYWEAFTQIIAVLLAAAKPLLVGCVIAYIVNILMSFYETHYFPKARKQSPRKLPVRSV